MITSTNTITHKKQYYIIQPSGKSTWPALCGRWIRHPPLIDNNNNTDTTTTTTTTNDNSTNNITQRNQHYIIQPSGKQTLDSFLARRQVDTPPPC